MGDLLPGLDEESVSAGEAFAHFGVKGMHWGVRKGEPAGEFGARVPQHSSGDHIQTTVIRSKAKHHGGIHALSNDELRVANERLSLEQNFHKLAAEKSTLDKGRAFVKSTTNDVNTIVTAVNTGRQAVKTANEVNKLIKKHKK